MENNFDIYHRYGRFFPTFPMERDRRCWFFPTFLMEIFDRFRSFPDYVPFSKDGNPHHFKIFQLYFCKEWNGNLWNVWKRSSFPMIITHYGWTNNCRRLQLWICLPWNSGKRISMATCYSHSQYFWSPVVAISYILRPNLGVYTRHTILKKSQKST